MGVAVLIGQRVAARNRPRIGALHLGERLAHQPEAHVHGVAYALGLATGLHQSVKLVVGVGVAERTAQRFFLLFLAGIGAAHAIRTASPPNPSGFRHFCESVILLYLKLTIIHLFTYVLLLLKHFWLSTFFNHEINLISKLFVYFIHLSIMI